jgi:hypothetical protein
MHGRHATNAQYLSRFGVHEIDHRATLTNAMRMRPRIVAVIAAGRLVHLTEASRLAAVPHTGRRKAAVAAE